MKRNIPLILIIISVIFGCDKSSVTSTPPEVTIQQFKMKPGESLSDKLTEKGLSQRYTCSVNTLNRDGSEKEFSHYSGVHFFSNEVESAARGKIVRYLFVYTGDSNSRNEWSLDEYQNVVRMAMCDLPDVPGIEQEMKMRLSDFDTDTWVISSQRRPEYSFHAKKMNNSKLSPI